jgi:acetyltransferase-like isoleucine patch superfamily enzyme
MSVEVVASQELPWVREARSKLGELSNGDTGLVATTYGSLPLSQDGETYQSNGVYIGPGARMGAGSLVSAKRLYLGPGAQIGSNCRLEADSVYIGANAKIGNHTDIVTGELILEDGTVVADQVVVDLAGGRSEESRLLVGGGSLISSRVIINTSREVVLDRESALSPGAMVFTHSFWQSVLERYSVASEGVRVCENAWVGAGCQIMPGVTIGPGSVVMSNSTVVEHVPPFSLVGGVPARLIRSNIRRELDHKEQATILLKTVRDFIRGLEFTGCAVEGTPDPGTFSITLPDGANRHLTLLTAGQSPRSIVPSNSILITFGQEVSVSDQASVFDVTSRTFAGAEDRLTHELRNFLRRHGIRFRPYAWDPSHTRGL